VGETANIVGIYGAIDQAVRVDIDVANGRQRRNEVMDLLPAYRDDDTRWFEPFREIARPQESSLPEWPEALRGLAEKPAQGRMRARRLMVVAAAVRAFRRYAEDVDVMSLARDALVFEGQEENANRDALLEVLSEPALLGEGLEKWWDHVVSAVVRLGFISAREEVGPPPCVTRVSKQKDGTLAAVIETEFVTTVCDFERAIRFLEPVNWPRANDFWCMMTDTGHEDPPGTRHYHEVVAVDCPADTAFWTLSAGLGFRSGRRGDVAWTRYDLSRPPQEGDDVLVDRGMLRVERLDGGALLVYTSKEVLFQGAFGGLGLALMICALGYASVVEDLLFTSALDENLEGTELPEAGDPFTSPSSTLKQDAGLAGDRLRALIDHMATSAKACVDDFEASSKKAAEKSYTANDLAGDVARAGERFMRETAQAVDILWTKRD
jgi:hypothetical protein